LSSIILADPFAKMLEDIEPSRLSDACVEVGGVGRVDKEFGSRWEITMGMPLANLNSMLSSLGGL